MLLTIVIPTYQREQLLESSLRTLLHQTLSRETYALLIVDNAVRVETKRVAEQFGADYVEEPRIGLQHARNRGMAEAKTPWVLLLDDDIRLAPDFVEKFHNRLENAEFDGLGGGYTHWFSSPPPQWILKYYTKPMCPSSRLNFGEIKEDEYLFGGIMAIRRSAWEEVDGFTPGLSMIGKKIGRAGEDEFQRKLRANGCQLFYDPDITMEHLVQPYKYTLRGHLALAYASGRDGIGMRDNFPLTSWEFIKRMAIITGYSVPFNMARFVLKSGYYWQNALADSLTKYCFEWGRYVSSRQI
ncbi:GT2 family glycosyltransferase [Neolewinella xylanilytica]|uniref:GT2 family glycosyltransferase n=1 Tax=Neolewinella xylanilytica TaxID=1514080 RepID=A0A2S6I2J1_9BACT|nr:glycosyltransferase family 2 protein [Neolewinella xylanilytica]PPK85402.1 GT2 family glycosyltransferase [Neolewinella xylanilytica]